MELILIIQEELLKSAELTGLWEKKLRQIEKGEYEAKVFLEELKTMVKEVVYNVKADNRRPGEAIKASLDAKFNTDLTGQVCPQCGKGTLLKGKAAYGCSEWKTGCTYRKPFE